MTVATSMTLRSEAFADGGRIPVTYTGDGADVSPPLTWGALPEEGRELAVIVDDPDAPRGTFVHWLIYKIPPTVAGLNEHVEKTPRVNDPPGALQGVNSAGSIGYLGPAPPPGRGMHHYHFKLYVLRKELNVQQGLTKEQLLEAMKGNIIAEGSLIGTYER